MGLAIFTLIHVLISLVGIVTGLVVLQGWLAGVRRPGWTTVFLVTTVLTSVTGFGFPFTKLLPSHIVGIISLVVLAIAIYALYARHLAGLWRSIYLMTATFALFLNVFVLVAQLFQKVPALKALAPTGSEPPFAITEGVVLVLFVIAGLISLRRYRPALA